MSFQNKVLLLGISVLLQTLIACTSKEERIIIEKQAPVNMLESFQKSTESQCEQLACITLQKESLGKIFLLMASGKTAGSTPQWYDLKPLVVSFEKSGNQLALLGQNYNSIYAEIQTVNLLQTFKLISEDEKTVTFDWGQGLKSLIVQSPYDVDGVRGMNNSLEESSFSSLPIEDSFVRNIKFDEKNIELEQIAKVRSSAGKLAQDKNISIESREETLSLNIQIRSYVLSGNFKKKEFDKTRRVGFFVTKVSKPNHSQDLTNLITKWDLSPDKGPIWIRISSAVPADYLEAVKEAAFYWNKVFGRDVLQVKTGVDPQAGPEDRSIFVRWIPWLDSGAAYAIGQSDPLTGEVLRAQVFMPSVFTKVGSANLVALNGNQPVAAGAIKCDLSESFKSLNVLAKEGNKSQRLRLSQDAVRATVAHELGHALGLRHNFAGSFSAKVNAKEILDSAKSYLGDSNHLGMQTSTSIMDYVGGVDEILMSAWIKHSPLSYDKMAMDWAYSENQSALDESISKYCTDDDISLAKSQGLQAYGCERFDNGNNPLLRKFLDVSAEKENFIKVLFASIIGRLYPADQVDVVKDLDVVLQETEKWGFFSGEDLSFISQLIMETTKSDVPVVRFASLGSIKAGGILNSRMGFDVELNKEKERSLAEIGGYSKIFDEILRNPDGSIAVNWLDLQIEDLKNSAYLEKGVTLAGRDYSLSSAQQEKILQFFAKLSKLNKDILFKKSAALLPKLSEEEKDESGKAFVVTSLLSSNLMNDVNAENLAKIFFDLENQLSGEISVNVGSGLRKEVKVPQYYFSKTDRLKWQKLLSTKGLRFGMDLRKAQARKNQFDKISNFLKEVDPSLSVADEGKLSTLPQDLLKMSLVEPKAAEWLQTEITILLGFDKI